MSRDFLSNYIFMYRTITTLIIIAYFLLPSCQSKHEEVLVNTLFTEMPATFTGLEFTNRLKFDRKFNIYTYRNFYNGGGVALGDVNKDGLTDIYFIANMERNRLYLNEGNFKFKDVTAKAGVGGKRGWSTGVSMADVNGDGWLDIYVCNSGEVEGDNKQNELFINKGDGTFSEQAEKYGLADHGYSTHASFFDYDKDGDLDMYLLNNSYQAIGSFNPRDNRRSERDSVGGDKLFRNDENHFVDVSEQAGIYGSVIGFGLGVTVGDIDRDGWQDIYVSNDFFERDYIYMNNRDGTFRENLTQQMRSITGASMGADMADINHDGYPEIFVTEMLPEPEYRLKTKTTFEDWNKYQYNLKNGYYHQFTRNMLHLNNANGTFSEIGRLAKVEATDWSWGALIADLNNDGNQDIFIANGIYQDLIDQDFLNLIGSDEIKRSIISKNGVDYKKLIDYIPSERISNYAFAGNGGYHFENKAVEWGLATPSYSNGSAYGDLDNDGDLDLVVNNVNMPAFVYRNEADTLLKSNHWLEFILHGEGKNSFALGTKISIKHQGQLFYLEQMPMRGFESSMDYRPHFGLGTIEKVDTVLVEWYDGKVTLLENVPTNQFLTLNQKDAFSPSPLLPLSPSPPLPFKEVTGEVAIDYRHKENQFNDFDRDHLLYHMLSTEGPKICKGDVNGDGREDFFIGGASESAGALLVQLADGKFEKTNVSVFEKDKLSEDTDCLFFDADGDQDLDLFVASGGNEFPASSSALRDRLYLNDGRGRFAKAAQFPVRFESTSCVQAADFDGDGDLDLFTGVRLKPFLYGIPVNGNIWQNDGKGNFKNVTQQIAPELIGLGMITDALAVDYDNDKDQDLVIVGEWMPITFFENKNGTLKKVSPPILQTSKPSNHQTGKPPHRQTSIPTNLNTYGWWNCLKAADLDGDGDLDFVIGNHGLNSRFRASEEKPVSCYINDFDHNGSAEQIICTYKGDKSYPMALRQDLLRQIPSLQKKYLKFSDYAGQTMEDIFTPDQLESAIEQKAYLLESAVLLNNGDGAFELRKLPDEAQFSPIYGILVEDFDGDGKEDLLLGGNFYRAKPEVGRYDASYGLFLKGNGDGAFTLIKTKDSGFFLEGEVRDIISLKSPRGELVLVGRNNDQLQVFQYHFPNLN